MVMLLAAAVFVLETTFLVAAVITVFTDTQPFAPKKILLVSERGAIVTPAGMHAGFEAGQDSFGSRIETRMLPFAATDEVAKKAVLEPILIDPDRLSFLKLRSPLRAFNERCWRTSKVPEPTTPASKLISPFSMVDRILLRA